MNKAKVISAFRALAEELLPFSQELPHGHVRNGLVDGQADPYALMWWAILVEVADILEAQEREIGLKQIEHLRHRFLGGMGSFNDYCLDTNRFGDSAKLANQRLNEKRTELHKLLQ